MTGEQLHHQPQDFGAKNPLFRVLVIDDDETDREITVRHLSKAGRLSMSWSRPPSMEKRRSKKIRASRYALVVLDWKTCRA